MAKKARGLQALTKSELIVFTSELVDRANLAARLGRQYSGDRKLYRALGYPTDILLEDYLAHYVRQDMAKAIINRPANATWRGGVTLLESDDDKETGLEKAWKDLYKRLRLHSKFARLDRLTGIGHYGILLLGLDDVKTAGDFSKPVLTGERKLLYVKPLSEKSAKVKTWEENTSSERYGLPVIYDIIITNPGNNKSSQTKQIQVHYSRVIHVTEELLESETEGIPRLQAVFNRLMDLEKLVGGSAEMFWRGARPGYQGIVDKEYGEVDTVGLQDQFDEFEHNLRRYMINAGIEMKALEQQIADPSKHVDVCIQMISAVTGIPKRILMGSERGELASSQDEKAWKELIQARRDEFAEPSIVRPLADTLILYGVLPAPKEDYSVLWSDLWAPSEKEKAEVGKIRAEALAAYSRDPVSQEVIPPEPFSRYFLGLDDGQIEIIGEMKKEAVKEEVEDFGEEEE